MFLFNADPTIGISFAEIIPQEFQLQIKQFIYQAQNGYNGHCNFEHSYKGLTKVYSFAFFPAAKVSKRKQLEKIPVMLVIEEQKLIQAECENILCINPSTYNAFPFMIQILDNNRIIRDVNPKWLEVTGYTKSEVIGKSLTYFLDSNSNSVLQENPINCEVQYLNDVVVNIMTKDGTTLSCSNESILHVSKERQMLELSIMHPLI